MNISKKYDGLIISCITFLICFFTYFILNQEYLVSGFLTRDDNILMSMAIFGEPYYLENTSLQYLQFLIIDLFSVFNSIFIVRLSFLFIYSLSGVFIALIYSKYIEGRVLPAFLGITIATIPVAAEQIIFVSGSHSTLSLLFLVISLLMFDRVYGFTGQKFIFYNIAILAVLFISIFSSPVGFLAPVTLFLWLIVARFFVKNLGGLSTKKWLLFLAAMLTICILTYILAGLLNHHYSGRVGWTDFSVEQIVQNFLHTLKKVVYFYGGFQTTTFFLFISGIILFVILLFFSWFKKQHKNYEIQNNQFLLLGINSLILSAFTFAPASITTTLLDRYLVTTVILGLISVITLIVFLYKKTTLYFYFQGVVGVFALLLILSANVMRTKEIVHDEYNMQVHTHNAVQQRASIDSSKWTGKSQVVFLVTKDKYASPTMGLNHSSTWYLRYITKNPEIIGLLGYLAGDYPVIKKFPFVEQYRDEGSEYWELIDGHLSRVQMVGLEMDRPLFVYQQNKMGEFEPTEYILFSSKEGTNLVQFGQSYQEAKKKLAQFQQVCKQENDIFMWPTAQLNEYKSLVDFKYEKNLLNSKKFVFNGKNSDFIQISIPENEYFRLEFSLTNTSEMDSIAFNETSPPMPILNPIFALYQYPSSKTHFVARKESESYIIDENNSNQIDIFFEGVSGCAILFGFNNKLRGILTKQSLNSRWLLGKGYKNRYWKGEITNMKLKMLHFPTNNE